MTIYSRTKTKQIDSEDIRPRYKVQQCQESPQKTAFCPISLMYCRMASILLLLDSL